MSLGEAFIEVRADMRPFVRDLDRQVKVAIERVEGFATRELGDSMGRAGGKAGEKAGDEAGKGFKRRFKNSVDKDNKNIFIVLASALASALDDGISALPTEVKAAIVAGLLLASPLVGAILGAAIATALGLAVAGIGTLLAFQFEDVQERAVEFGRHMRVILALTAESFGPAILNAFDLIENRIFALEPVLRRIFDSAAGFVEPITVGLLEGLDAFVQMLDRITPKLQPFVETFALGLESTLKTLAQGLERMASTGQAGQQALQDLFLIVNALIGAFFGLLELLTMVNQLFHQMWEFAKEINPALAFLADLIGKDIPNAEGTMVVTNTEAAASFNGLIAATSAEEQEAKKLISALDKLVEATFDNIQVDIDFERSLDRVSDSLRENGKTLDIHTEKGRQNVEAFTKGLKDAEAQALHRLQVQGYTAEQAAQLYNQDVEQLKAVARQAGITDAQFQAMFGDIIAVSQLRLSSEEMGVDGLASGLDDATAAALSLLNLIKTLQRTTISGAIGGAKVPGYADGDIVNRPTLGMFGESGPEVIIPLSKPARAAELAQKSGLTTMLSDNGTVVMVFIGEERLESRMVKVVERNNKNQALNLSQGPRRF